MLNIHSQRCSSQLKHFEITFWTHKTILKFIWLFQQVSKLLWMSNVKNTLIDIGIPLVSGVMTLFMKPEIPRDGYL